MHRRRLALLTVLVTAATISLPGLARATPGNPRLAQVGTWAFAIGDGALGGDVRARFTGFDLVVVDGEEVTAGQVDALRANGSLVLGYLDVGAIERGRFWSGRARRYRLDYWPDWGEWYANVAAPGYRTLLSRRVAPRMLRKGLDGLFIDNVDMIETHRRQRRGMRKIVKRLAGVVHRRGGFLFAQNGEDVISPMLKFLDGWNREDLGFTYNFDRRKYEQAPAVSTASAQKALRKIAAAGLLTTATSYTDGSASQTAEAVKIACDAGAIPFVSDIGLARIGTPLRCGQAG